MALIYLTYSKDVFNPGIVYLVYIPFLIGIILNALAYSKANEGYVTFGNIFESCFKAVLIIMAVRVAWIPVSDFVFPEVKERALAEIHNKLLYNSKMTEEQVNTAFNIAKKVWFLGIIGSVIFATLFYGVIFSLIGGAIAEKKGLRLLEIDKI